MSNVDLFGHSSLTPKDIVTEGNQLFNVPNTPEGNEFVRLAGKFLNKSRFNRLGKKGRGKNRPKHMFSHELRVKDAEWFAVYAYKSYAQWNKEYAKIKERDEVVKSVMEKEIRMKLAQDQLNGKSNLFPETIALLRGQVIKEHNEIVRKQRNQIVTECQAALESVKRG